MSEASDAPSANDLQDCRVREYVMLQYAFCLFPINMVFVPGLSLQHLICFGIPNIMNDIW